MVYTAIFSNLHLQNSDIIEKIISGYFWENLISDKNENFQQFHSAEKNRTTLWDLLTSTLLQNIKKIERGPFVSFGFVYYVKKEKHKRGPLH